MPIMRHYKISDKVQRDWINAFLKSVRTMYTPAAPAEIQIQFIDASSNVYAVSICGAIKVQI